MRILIFANSDIGLYKFRKELLEEFARNNYEVYASLPKGDFNEHIVKLCHFIDTEMNRRGANPFEEFKLYRSYLKILKEVKPDIVLTYTIKCIIYGGLACKTYKVPYITNVTGLGSALENKGLLQGMLKTLYRWALSKDNKIFFQNRDNLKFLLENRIIQEDYDYDMIPGSGVNPRYYIYTPFPDDKTIDFLFAGRMMAEKGFEQYLDAAEYIHSKYPATRFHIAGIKEENYESRVNDLVSRGICVYHGMVDDMRPIYQQIQCIVHPTYYPEGMSNVLLEACSSGRAVITTDRAGCKEIVDDGVNGYIVKARDSKDLIEKIEKFLSLSNEQRSEMGKNARKKIEEQFDRQIVIDKYMQEIRKHEK